MESGAGLPLQGRERRGRRHSPSLCYTAIHQDRTKRRFSCHEAKWSDFREGARITQEVRSDKVAAVDRFVAHGLAQL